MEIIFQTSPQETKRMNTEELRKNFLMEGLMTDDEIKLVYSHYDRIIIGGAKPVNNVLQLEADPELKADYFLERRELGIINIGGSGVVGADGELYTLSRLDCLYLGKGVKEVSFKSENSQDSAMFYLLSVPAHQAYPSKKLTKEEATPSTPGDVFTANKRTIYKYIHADGIRSAQLVMGLTVLDKGSVWNTMPPHTHTRRTEAYFYFGLPEAQTAFHFMGEPQETRHLAVQNNSAVISPPWSIHSGCGTANYGFIWGMAGENYTYTDMDAVAITDLR